ncbi:hypothetical protein [Halomonas organivorans]|uniref:Uncharacterized protein n=1 Tax=Halomonas organivorans TaxID=257772 RepID=A0A7W5G7P3_9GAMM|nr:hypothetical protein [Halomonas organivorans]MBB3142731.1 hypothetical protein [Halomonas organivorans]
MVADLDWASAQPFDEIIAAKAVILVTAQPEYGPDLADNTRAQMPETMDY